MATSNDGHHLTMQDQQRSQLIDKWMQEQIDLIKQIANSYKVEDDHHSADNRLGTSRNLEITERLDRSLRDIIIGEIGGGSLSQSRFINDSEQTVDYDDDSEQTVYYDDDSSVSSPEPDVSRGFRPLSTSQQLSMTSDISESAGQVVHLKQKPSRLFDCYKDNETGVMAINGNQLVYLDWVKRHDGYRTLKMRVASDISRGYHIQEINFPGFGHSIRIVDMEFSPKHNKYILGLVSGNRETIRFSGLCLFDPARIELGGAIQKWIPCAPNDIIARVCCSSETIYEIVRNYRKNVLILLEPFGTVKERKPAEQLFPEELMVSGGGLRLADISCSPADDRLAVAYNCSDGDDKGPIGVYIFNPNQEWLLIGRVDLGQTNIEFNVPRLTYLHRINLFIALNSRNGNLIAFDSNGKQLGKRSFIFLAPQYEEDEPVIFPFNICATQNWAAIRYNRIITINRIND